MRRVHVFCDRCEAPIDSDLLNRAEWSVPEDVAAKAGVEELDSADLCTECFVAFASWLRKRNPHLLPLKGGKR